MPGTRLGMTSPLTIKAPNFMGCNCPPKKEDVVGRLMLSA
jgi:hypothetical protein